VLHGLSLDFSDEHFAKAGYERRLLETGRPAVLAWWAGARDRLYHGLFWDLLTLPRTGEKGSMPLHYRGAYGSSSGLRAHIDAGHGTTIDPSGQSFTKWDKRGFLYTLSSAVEARLRILASAIHNHGARNVYLIIAPIPLRYDGQRTSSSRRQVVRTLQAIFDIETAEVLIPALNLPDDLFVSATHLNEDGRSVYTDFLAAALRAQTRCSAETGAQSALGSSDH
jgi:hypothetical protein